MNNVIEIKENPLLIREYNGNILIDDKYYDFYIRASIEELDVFWYDLPKNSSNYEDEILEYFQKTIV